MNATINTVTTSPVLSSKTCQLIKTTCSGDIAIRNKWRFLGEGLVSEGVTSLMLNKPSKGEYNPNEKLHGQINSAIESSFDDATQKLLKAEPKTLDQIQKGVRHYWIQQKASLFNKIRAHVVEVEKGDTKDTRTTKTKVQRILEKLGEARKLAKSMESPTFDVKAFDIGIQQAEKMVKGIK